MFFVFFLNLTKDVMADFIDVDPFTSTSCVRLSQCFTLCGEIYGRL